jgi:hypothetical protein
MDERYRSSSSSSSMVFTWDTREALGGPAMGRLLRRIRRRFQQQIGDTGYWTRLVADKGITHVLRVRNDGFVLIRHGWNPVLHRRQPRSRQWYVELIVSLTPGLGTVMMDEVERRAKSQGIRRVALSALPNVIVWYARRGYTLGGGCGPGSRCAVQKASSQTAAAALCQMVQAKVRVASTAAALRHRLMQQLLKQAWQSHMVLKPDAKTLREAVTDGVFMQKEL